MDRSSRRATELLTTASRPMPMFRPLRLRSLAGHVLVRRRCAGSEMEPHYYIVEPGAGSDGAYDRVGEELIFRLSGSLEVWLDEREHYTMAAGDCLYFPSTLPHRWQKPSQERTALIRVNTPPTFSRGSHQV